MSIPLFLFRPEPGWTATANLARAKGLEVSGHPLFSVEPLAWEAPNPAAFDALLIGSANVFRHGGSELAGLATLPVLSVGQATTEAAEAAGFVIEAQGSGGLQGLLDTLSGRTMRLLRLGGEIRVPLDVPEGITISERAVYRTQPVPLDSDTYEQLVEGGVVALYSGEAAVHFAKECQRLGIDRSELTIVALAPRVAQMAGEGWKAVHIADAPSDTQLLAITESLCKSL